MVRSRSCSPDEAAKWLGVPKTTFHEWIGQRSYPLPQKINRAVQFYSWDVV
jgi:predicted DNA-binding transcriptional regulator AlpA